MTIGPKAVANIKAERAMTASTLFMSRSFEIVVRAGAMIVETMMRLKPVAESTSVTVHFFELDQHLSCVSKKGHLGLVMVILLRVLGIKWLHESYKIWIV